MLKLARSKTRNRKSQMMPELTYERVSRQYMLRPQFSSALRPDEPGLRLETVIQTLLPARTLKSQTRNRFIPTPWLFAPEFPAFVPNWKRTLRNSGTMQ